MKECIGSYFILNGQVRSCDTFDNQLINKGLSVYEVVRLMGTTFLFLEDHLARLHSSMELAYRDTLISNGDLLEDLRKLVYKNNLEQGNVKIVVNNGDDGSRNYLVYFVHHRYPAEQDYINGVKVITFPFERPDPNRKIWRPVFRKDVAEAMKNASAFEALLVDSSGCITEASKANVFALIDNQLITPPDDVILPGISRKYILNICEQLRLPVTFRPLNIGEIPEYKMLFLSGTSFKVLPVSRINDVKIPVNRYWLDRISGHFEKIIHEYLIHSVQNAV